MIIWYYLMIVLFEFDEYLHYCDYLLHWNITLLCSRCKNVNVNDSPFFAFARLCCLTMQAERPARSAKIVSDLFVSSLQSAPHACHCMTAVNTSHSAPRGAGWVNKHLSPWFTSRARESGWSWTGERGIETSARALLDSRALVRLLWLASALVSSWALW